MQRTDHSTTSDEQLVRRACYGDIGAFEAIFRRHASKVHAFLLRMCRNASEAEDLTQEVFIRAWQHLGRFEGRSTLLTWLMGIAVGTYRMHARSAARRRNRDHRWHESEALKAEDRQPDVEGLIDLERAIATLPDRARAVLVLHRIHGHPLREVADMLGISVGTCKAHVHRAKRRLRREMSR